MIRLFIFTVAIMLCFSPEVFAGEERQWIREGNKLYEEGQYQEAEIKYRRALETDSGNFRALFNLGNALYKQGRFEEASEIFDILSQIGTEEQERAKAFHNLGNAHMGSQRFGESIEAYKNALRLNPDDEDTRYNLAYAKNFLEDPPEQEPQPEDQNGDGESEEDQEGQQPPPPGEDDSGDEYQQPDAGPEPASDQLSPRDAERILDALNQQEQKVQEKINRDHQKREPVRTEKEW